MLPTKIPRAPRVVVSSRQARLSILSIPPFDERKGGIEGHVG